MYKIIDQAVSIIKQGGIIVYPTDTAFGVGCSIDDKHAIERLFKIRKRPKNQAVPVLVGSINMAKKYIQSPTTIVRHLMKDYWPGALTIITTCQHPQEFALVCGGGSKIGLRMPHHTIPLSIINSLGCPILGPSANFHGQSTPYKIDDLDHDFLKLVDLVIYGNCPLGKASTVVDTTSLPMKIIRQGAVNLNLRLIKNYD